MELNFEVLEIKKWNIPIDRAQRRDEKNEVIFLFIMLTPRVMVIKMSKIEWSLRKNHKTLIKIFQVLKLWLIFRLHQQKIQKWAIFYTLMNSGDKHDK